MELCLGTVQFGIDYGVQGAHKPSQEIVDNIIDKAVENGIYSYDTAAVYGNAERLLGDYFSRRTTQIKKFEIISKLAANVFEGYPKKNWREIVLKNANLSLSCLNIPSFEAYLFHNAAYIFSEDAVRALYSVVEEGMAKRVGVSVYTPEEAVKALEYDEIGVIQIPYNLFDHRLDNCNFFEKAKQKRVKIYARSSLLQGLAVMAPDKLPKKMQFAEGYIRRFHKICNNYNISPLEAAIGYVGSHKGIDYIVFGVDNQKQLEEYILIKNKPISDEMLNRLKAEFDDVEEKLVNPVLWK